MDILEIPFGGGYNDLAVDVGNGIAMDESPNSINIDYSRIPNACCKAEGERQIGTGSIVYPLPGSIQLVYEGAIWADDQWLNKRIVVANGTLYYYCPGGFFVPIGDGMVETGLIDATHYIDRFVIADGENTLQSWDGTGALGNLVLGDPADFTTLVAKTVDTYKDYCVIGNTIEDGERCPNRYRWSTQGNPEDWPSANSNDLVTKAGDEIVRIVTVNEKQVCFKRQSVHNSIWTGGALIFDWNPINEKTVNIAPHTIARAGDIGLLFYSEEGIMFTDGDVVQELPVSQKVQDILRRVYNYDMNVMSATSSDTLHQYWLAVPLRGSSTNNVILIYDWKYDKWAIRDYDAACLGVWKNENLGTWADIEDYTWAEVAHLTWRDLIRTGSRDVILGKSTGYVNKKGFTFSHNGDAYNARHETGWIEPVPSRYCEVMMFQPWVAGIAGTTFTVEYAVDSAPTTWIPTLNHTFVQTNVVEMPLIGLRKTCRKVKLRVSNDNADEYFNLYKGYLHYQPRGYR